MSDNNLLNIEKLNSLIERFEQIEDKLSKPLETKDLISLSKERSNLEPAVIAVKKYKKCIEDINSAQELLNDDDSDNELKELAYNDYQDLKEELEELTSTLKIALIPKDDTDDKDVILEIRAGTGGDEASLFVGDLLRMYERFAASQGWKMEILEFSEGTVGGYKEVIAQIKGNSVFSKLKFESGVHRVQRVPDTETEGRIHTSAATVAVLPEAEEVDIEIKDAELKIDTFRASGAGGQHVNTTDSAIRITHIPTGTVVVQQSERSQHANKLAAMRILRSRIYANEQEKLAKERSEARKVQVGSGDRSERIRTYNFPQGRLTDHRIGLTLYKLEEIMEGSALVEVIDALNIENQTKLLSEIETN